MHATKKKFILFGLSVLLCAGIVYAFIGSPGRFILLKGSASGPINSNDQRASNPESLKKGIFTGIECPGATTRPFAVMMSGDNVTRPLSGFASADMVVEMPVVVNDVTRYLAFYQCSEPEEIGSVRSARGPFIGVAKGYDAILAHWGGEHDALDQLRGGIIDNLDGLISPFNSFWRKNGIPMPHDGFTSYQRLFDASKQLGYRLESVVQDSLFTFKSSSPCPTCPETVITIGYPGLFAVAYHYKPEINAYLRFKGGTPELDALTKQQIQTKNVLVVRAKIYHTYSQYAQVELDGKQGELQAFIGGKTYSGIWKKDSLASPLLFYDLQEKPLPLEPGTIWVQVVGLDQNVDVTPLTPSPFQPSNPVSP